MRSIRSDAEEEEEHPEFFEKMKMNFIKECTKKGLDQV